MSRKGVAVRCRISTQLRRTRSADARLEKTGVSWTRRNQRAFGRLAQLAWRGRADKDGGCDGNDAICPGRACSRGGVQSAAECSSSVTADDPLGGEDGQADEVNRGSGRA